MVLTGFPSQDVGRAMRGAALVDALIALVVLGLGAAAVTTTMLAASHGGRAAALDGRRAELAVRTADRLRTGLLPGSSGSFVESVGGERFDVRYARRDDVAPGAIELVVGPVLGGPRLRLAPAAPALQVAGGVLFDRFARPILQWTVPPEPVDPIRSDRRTAWLYSDSAARGAR